MAVPAWTPGLESFDWTSQDGKTINGQMMNDRIQGPLIAALGGLQIQACWLLQTGTPSLGGAGSLSQIPFNSVGNNSLGLDFTSGMTSAVIKKAGLYLCMASVAINSPGAGISWIAVSGGPSGTSAIGNTVGVSLQSGFEYNKGQHVCLGAFDVGQQVGARVKVSISGCSLQNGGGAENSLVLVYLGDFA